MLSPTAALLAAVVAAATPRPAATGAALHPAPAVRIVSQSARWTSLLADDALKSDGENLFLISGEIENRGATPVRWVKIGYQLLADTPDGETILASEYGYNRRAEALRGEPPGPESDASTTAIRPIEPGEKDLFRMVFFRRDVPHFDRWRVIILETR